MFQKDAAYSDAQEDQLVYKLCRTPKTSSQNGKDYYANTEVIHKEVFGIRKSLRPWAHKGGKDEYIS